MLNAGRLPTYIPIEEAAARYGLDLADLEAAVERGLVRAVATPNGGDTPQVLVAEEDIQVLDEIKRSFDALDSLPRFTPLAEIAKAAKRCAVPVQALIKVIESGTIRVSRSEGGLFMDERSIKTHHEALQIAEEARKKTHHLKGTAITITQAAEKYNLPHSTISRWVKAGHIQTLGKKGRRVFVDEGDVAYCVAVYKAVGGGQGKRIFNKKGLPYVPKTL